MSSWPAIKTIAEGVNKGSLKAVDLVEQALDAINQKQEFNAVISSLSESAHQRAKLIDDMVYEGKNVGRLAGVPFVAKDNFLVFGGETTAASNILRGFNAPYQSTAIDKLEAEGAICVAKANLDAFAHGTSTENSDFGTTLNPHDPTRVPGGSSGGSAASVVLEIAPFAIGSDTGGSIRQPASFCGIVGYKPTYGLVSRYGVVAMASSTDTIGPLARNVEEASLILDCMAGKDVRDSTTISRQGSYVIGKGDGLMKKVRVGLVKEFMGAGIDDDVRESIDTAVAKLKKSGVEVIDVSIPSIEIALAAYYVIVPAEISSNLSRYDGQRYGFSVKDGADLEEVYMKSRGLGFGAEAKRRIMIGSYMLSSGFYEAYYKKAALVRTKLINECNEALKKVDFLVGPVAPSSAFKIGENSTDPLKMYLEDIMTVPVNLVGVPAVSLPVKPSGKMPVGLQIIASMGHDKELLQFAFNIEGVVN